MYLCKPIPAAHDEVKLTLLYRATAVDFVGLIYLLILSVSSF